MTQNALKLFIIISSTIILLKLMHVGVFDDEGVNTIQAEGGELESVEEFCYLGSVVSRDSSL